MSSLITQRSVPEKNWFISLFTGKRRSPNTRKKISKKLLKSRTSVKSPPLSQQQKPDHQNRNTATRPVNIMQTKLRQKLLFWKRKKNATSSGLKKRLKSPTKTEWKNSTIIWTACLNITNLPRFLGPNKISSHHGISWSPTSSKIK